MLFATGCIVVDQLARSVAGRVVGCGLRTECDVERCASTPGHGCFGIPEYGIYGRGIAYSSLDNFCDGPGGEPGSV